MPTLLQINTVVNTCSHGRIAEEIGQIALANGWKSFIAYGRNDRPSQSALIKIGSNYDIKFHGLQTRIFDRHGLGSKNATLTLVARIKEIKPDIIHLHNLHGYYINIEVLFNYLAAANIPVIWTLHDCWSMTGHCSHFDFIGCDKWETKCFRCPQKNEYPASYGLDRSERNYMLKKKLFTSVNKMTIVPISQWLGEIVRHSFLKDYLVKVINNGIDITIFKPLKNERIRFKYNIQGKFIILGAASKWSVRKGFSDFIELSKIMDINCIIILVGLNAKQIKDLPQNIIGISRTENTKQLAEIYSTSDVFLNPTWEDSFPTTNLESLSCGTPVITYNTGGSKESIDSNTGFVIQKGNIHDIIMAIETIKKFGKKQYSEACRTRVLKMYNKDDRFRDYLNLYEHFLSMDKTNSPGNNF